MTTPRDLKPRVFPTVDAFLARAKELIQQNRVLWDRRRQMGHDVEQWEAEQVAFWARPRDAKEHWTLPGHYLIWGRDQRHRLIRVWATIGPDANGDDVLGLEAFEEHRTFGS